MIKLTESREISPYVWVHPEALVIKANDVAYQPAKLDAEGYLADAMRASQK
jgi:hypothetical protein